MSFIAGITIGAVAGAALGLLLAPEKGEKTRGIIASKSKELKKDLEDQVEHSKEKIEKFANSVIQQINNSAKKVAKDALSKAENAVDNA